MVGGLQFINFNMSLNVILKLSIPIVSNFQYPEISAKPNAIIEMAVSFNNKYLALFTDTGLLWIGSSDLQKVYCEFDTKCPTRPQQLVWYVSRLY